METEINTQALLPSDADAATAGPAIESGTAKHFDTFETHFFQQGDDASALGGEDRFDDSDYGKERMPLVSYRSLVGVSIASSAVAIAACIALFTHNAPSTSPMAALVAPARAAVVAPATTVPAAKEPAPQVAATAPIVAVPLQPAGNSVAQPQTAPALAAAASPGTPAVAKAPEQAAHASADEPKADKPAKASAPKDDTEKVVQAKVEPAATDEPKAQPQVAAAAPLRDGDARERCRQSMRSKRAKDIATACAEAFAEDSSDVDAAIAVAKVELDRGRFAQASTWSKKAIAVNPDSAEAYVFAGGAEQNQGHGKAAKEAYLHYLRLAPSGRYAAEIRSIVSSL